MVNENDKRIIELGLLTLSGLEEIEKSNINILRGREKLKYYDKKNINGEISVSTAKQSNARLEAARINKRIPFTSLIKVQNLTTDKIFFFALQREFTSGSFTKENMKLISRYGKQSSLLLESKVGSEIELGNEGKFIILRRVDFEPKKFGSWDGTTCKLYEKDFDFPKTINTIKKDIISKNKLFIRNENLIQDSLLIENIEQFKSSNHSQNVESSININYDKPIVDNNYLQNQVALSHTQERFLRLPIGGKYLITGPAGTGKTSLLIKRIAQKSKKDFLTKQEKSDYTIENYFKNKSNTWVLFSNRPDTQIHLSQSFLQEHVKEFEQNILSWNEFLNNFKDLLINENIRFDISFNEEDVINTGFPKKYSNYLVDKTICLEILLSFYRYSFTERSIKYLNNLLHKKNNLTKYLNICIYMDENGIFSKFKQIFKNEKKKATIIIKNSIDSNNNIQDDLINQVLLECINDFKKEEKNNNFKSNKENKLIFKSSVKTMLGGYLRILSELHTLIELEKEYKKIVLFDLVHFQNKFLKWNNLKRNQVVHTINSELFCDFIEFILILSNNLFGFDKINTNLKKRSSLYFYITENYKREVLVEEITDFSLKQLNIIQLLCYPGTSNIFMTGDLQQLGNSGNLLNEKKLEDYLGEIKCKYLKDVYRFKPSLFNMNNYLYSFLKSEENSLRNAYNKASDKYLPIATELQYSYELVPWIIDNIKIILSELNQRFSVGIIVYSREKIKYLQESLERQENIELSIYHIDEVKGREFELLFIIDIDNYETDDLFVRKIYTAISRASGFLAVSYSSLNNQFLKDLIGRFFVENTTFDESKKISIKKKDIKIESSIAIDNISATKTFDSKIVDDGTIWELDQVKYDPGFWLWLRKDFERSKKEYSKKEYQIIEKIITILNKVHSFCNGFAGLTEGEFESAKRIAKFAKENGFKYYITSLINENQK